MALLLIVFLFFSGRRAPYSKGIEILLTPIYRLGKNLLGEGSPKVAKKFFFVNFSVFLGIKENNKITRSPLCKHSIKDSGAWYTVMLSGPPRKAVSSHVEANISNAGSAWDVRFGCLTRLSGIRASLRPRLQTRMALVHVALSWDPGVAGIHYQGYVRV